MSSSHVISSANSAISVNVGATALVADGLGVYHAVVGAGPQHVSINNFSAVPGVALPDFLEYEGSLTIGANISVDITIPVVVTTVHVVDPNGSPVAGVGIANSWTGFAFGCGAGSPLSSCDTLASTSSDIAGNPATTDASGNVVLYVFRQSSTLTATPPSGSNLATTTATLDTTVTSAITIQLL